MKFSKSEVILLNAFFSLIVVITGGWLLMHKYFILGLIFCFLSIFIILGLNIYRTQYKEKGKKKLHNLIPLEKKLLGYYINENTRTHQFSIYDQVVNDLIDADILYKTTKVKNMFDGMYNINITEWVFEYLHKNPKILEREK